MRTTRQRVTSGAVLGAALATMVALCTQAGCNKKSLQQPGSAAPTGEVRASGEAAGEGAAANKPAAEVFQIAIEAARGKVGQELVTLVKVVPRGGYKINLEYPHRLKVSGPEGATPREATLAGKDAQVTKAELVFKPACKLAAAGEHPFAGTLRFSVCTDKQCELKAEKVKWTVQVTSE